MQQSKCQPFNSRSFIRPKAQRLPVFLQQSGFDNASEVTNGAPPISCALCVMACDDTLRATGSGHFVSNDRAD
jgi:hypothetical protein